MTTPTVDNSRLASIFFPHWQARSRAVLAAGGRFVYYTSADVAASMFRYRQIWLRNALVMNDFSEIAYGFRCLAAAYGSEPGARLKEALARCDASLPDEVERMFNGLLPAIQTGTYIFCVSEHLAEEDIRGRLSMWRAYGGRNGVAVVLNGGPMFAESHVLGAYSSPVLYADNPTFAAVFDSIAARAANETGYLEAVGRETVKSTVLEMLRFAVLCTKHPGFQEEREWRVVATPSVYPSDHVESAIETIRGTPQQVLKIKLENIVDGGLSGMTLNELVNRVIVGPCDFPGITADALTRLLVEAGVDRANERVIVSDIPLRHDH